MPYELKKFNNGYKVCKKIGDKKCYSNTPIPYLNAYKQRQAIGIHEGLYGGADNEPEYLNENDYLNDITEEVRGGAEKWDVFKNYLKKFNITENNYLINARIKAGNAGYDERKLFFADDGIHKLVYDSKAGKIKFGRVGYKDYIIYKFIAYFEKNKFKRDKLEDEAEMYRDRFQKSHKAISIKHKLGNLSPNELALKILW